MPERFRCAVASLDRAEAAAGTASTVRRWFVVEQPGSWGRDAVLESTLPAELARELRGRARRAGVRMVLMRRAVAGPRRRAYAAFSGPGGAWLERHEFEDPRELLAVDLSGIEGGGGTGGAPEPEPLALTCTNGRHDACCAEFGRPVAAALGTLLGDRAWEVSHIGGDRFAPNVLVLPYGLYYGRVTLAQVPDLARAVSEGRVWLPGYRGRSIHPFAVQAAEAAVREARRADAIDAVQVAGWRQQADLLHVDVVADGMRWHVAVETSPNEDAWPLTCRADHEARPPVHRIALLEPAGQA